MRKKEIEDVRREQFPVRWSPVELAMLKAGARRRQMKPSEYLRWLVSRDVTRARAAR